MFTFVNAGQPGQVGDAFTWNLCSLKHKIESGELLRVPSQHVNSMWLRGVLFSPYLVADSAFALSTHLMKCYEVDRPTPAQLTFNYALVRTRRVVECAFGRLKMRFRVIQNSRLSDPGYAANIVLVLCAVHNFLQRRKQRIDVNEEVVGSFVPSDDGSHGRPQVDDAPAVFRRNVLAAHLSTRLQVSPAMRRMSRSAVMYGPVGYSD